MSTPSFSDSDEERTTPAKLFGRQRSIREVLGGGKVANVVLWEDRIVSAGLLIGVALIWFLFEIVEYTFVTLLCHILITTMLVVFIWSAGADIFNWNSPKVPDVLLEETLYKEAALIVHARFQDSSEMLFSIACGKNPKLFFLVVVFLWILSIIGTYVSFVNLLFVGFLCIETLPYLYQRYEEDVDDLAYFANRRIRRIYKIFNLKVLGKIPRGPVKEKSM
ncbi:reticulon-like protein B9 [Malania oleifera]|uniref:reticulon-like protein B9 n=1 Tax=Malania oleifera TaxID=397392 RepID=UPI0025AE9E73|nr:reticulon-like protein B9 [Malania oleifera]